MVSVKFSRIPDPTPEPRKGLGVGAVQVACNSMCQTSAWWQTLPEQTVVPVPGEYPIPAWFPRPGGHPPPPPAPDGVGGSSGCGSGTEQKHSCLPAHQPLLSTCACCAMGPGREQQQCGRRRHANPNAPGGTNFHDPRRRVRSTRDEMLRPTVGWSSCRHRPTDHIQSQASPPTNVGDGILGMWQQAL